MSRNLDCASPRGAQLEVEELKRQNGQAQARIAELHLKNTELRRQLGLPTEDGGPKCLPWREANEEQQDKQDGPDNQVIIEEAEDNAGEQGTSDAAEPVLKEPAVEIE